MNDVLDDAVTQTAETRIKDKKRQESVRKDPPKQQKFGFPAGLDKEIKIKLKLSVGTGETIGVLQTKN